ncbi:MAG: alpha/beta hydrolase [Gemmatimonadota bacterium]|nr:MAG: alpha/beta hydrolase [Gemmatimonadota bacterium]
MRVTLCEKPVFAVLVALLASLSSQARAQDTLLVVEPVEHVYSSPGGLDLKAYVFKPASDHADAPRSAIVIFHGGGWHIGSAEWAFPIARHFAELGMIAIAVQYRLSDQNSITPLEAMADARAAIRWTRSNSGALGILVHRIAAYGWSAGAHLAACAAIFDDSLGAADDSSAPDALILVSPALSLESDNWVQTLLGDRASASRISPDEHVRGALPPTIILQGRTDTVTPLAGSQRFCDRMIEAGNRCDLHIYEGVGHLFTPSSEPDGGMPNPDPEVQAEARREAGAFLRSLGYVTGQRRDP